MYLGGNDQGGENSSIRIFAIIYWDVPLSFTDFEQLIRYLQAQNTIPT